MSQISYGSLTITDTTDSIQSALIYLYIRSASVPTVPQSSIIYNFTTGLSSSTVEGWYVDYNSVPSSNDPIWMITAMALAPSGTSEDIIESSDWSIPTQSTGASGTDGKTRLTIYLYQRATSTPSKPSASTYTFSNNTYNIPTGWHEYIPDSDGKPCYVTSATALASASASTATLAWVTPVKLVEDGAPGTSYYTHILYAKNSSPTAQNQTSTNPSGMSYIAIITNTTQNDPAWNDNAWNGKWVKFVGDDGADGATGATGTAGRSLSGTTIHYTQVTSNTTQAQVEALSESNWTANVPTYNSSKPAYWVRVTNTFTNPSGTSYIFYKDNGLTDSNANASTALSIAQNNEENAQGALSIAYGTRQHFFSLTEDYSTSVPAGSYMTEVAESSFKANPSGGNLLTRSDGVYLRKGANTLASLTGSALTFYRPGTTTADAILNSSGLNITNGSIKLGKSVTDTSSTSSGSIALSNSDFTRNILGTNRTTLRFAIGANFGVATDGTLYANAGIIGNNVTIGGTSASTLVSNASTALASSVEYIVGTHGTTATNVWTGVTRESLLVAGKTIAFYMTSAGTTTAATLNLTLAGGGTTGAKNVRINNSNVTNQFPQNTIINLTYDGTYWKCDNYDSNTYDRTRYNVSVTASAAISSARIGVFNTSDKLILLSTTAFDITKPILYIGTAYTSDALTQTNNYTMYGVSFNLTNTHAITGAAAGATVYIVGTLSGTTFTPNSTVLTCTKPTSKDNLVYIRLGRMVSTTNAVLEPDHPLYMYYNDVFQQCDPSTATAAMTATNYITNIDSNNGITIKAINGTANSNTTTGNYIKLNASGLYIYQGGIEQAYFGNTARIGKTGTNKRNVYVTDSAVQIRNNTTVLAEYGSTIRLNKPDGTEAATITADGINMTAGSIDLGNFKVSTAGAVTASNITATGGHIGGFDLKATYFQCYGNASGVSDSSAGLYRYLIQASPGTNGGNAAWIVQTRASTSDSWVSRSWASYNGSMGATSLTIYDSNKAKAAETTTNGLVLYKAGSKRAAVTANGLDIFGSDGQISIASFGATATIGQINNGKSRVEIKDSGVDFYNRASNTDVVLAHIGYASGTAQSGTATAPYYDFGIRKSGTTKGNYSVAEGYNTTASGYASHVEGFNCKATMMCAHAEGDNTSANTTYSHAEGMNTETRYIHGTYASHAGGRGTVTNGSYRTAIGSYNTDDLQIDTFTGNGTTKDFYTTYPANNGVNGGYDVEVTVDGVIPRSASRNDGNRITLDDPIPPKGSVIKITYPRTATAFVIGNGTANNARSNAFTVDWSGNVNIASGAKYKINGTNLSASDVGAVSTSRLDCGKVSITPTAGQVTSKAVTFNHTFSSAPNVVATAQSSVPNAISEVTVSNVTTTGFTMYLLRSTNVSTNIYWIAML